VELARRHDRRFDEIERRFGDVERRISDSRADIELMVKAELLGRLIPILGLADSHFGRLDSQELWIVRFLFSKRESGPGFSHGRGNRNHAERFFGERSSASGEPRLGWSPSVSAFGAGDGS